MKESAIFPKTPLAMKKILSLAGVSILLLSGCASQPQPEQLAHGIKLQQFHADIPYKEDFTRAANISHVFGVRIYDVDPEKIIISKTENELIGNVINGAVEYGWEGALVGAGKALTRGAITTYRGEVDEWNAIIDADQFDTIYDAQVFAHDAATDLTVKAMQKAGYQTTVTKEQRDPKTGELLDQMVNVISLTNKKLGCPKATDEKGCIVKVFSPLYNFASREATPAWLNDSKDSFVIRSLVVNAEGKKADGSDFTLTREERETIGKMSQKNFFYYGAYGRKHPAFLGENGQISYCYMLPAMLEKSRAHAQKGLAERMADKYKKDWEDRGMLMFLDGLKP